MKLRNNLLKELGLAIVATLFFSCLNTGKLELNKVVPAVELENAATQYQYMIKELNNRNLFPKTFNMDTYRLQTSDSEWWCSGFYPGTLFYLFEETGKQDLYEEGIRMLGLLDKEQYNVDTHDIGFMMYCSYGNALRIVSKPEYKDVLVNSAKSLITRFNPVVGCLKSHNRKPTDFVVIIDNMMNLELLFWATQTTGDSTYWDIAVKHADTTLKNHFRSDGSIYHGINYDPETGAIQHYQAGQGYTEQSPWSRGQAWGLYGFTMMYRFTQDRKYLDKAVEIADYLFNHPNMPADYIPYWDLDTPNIPHALRDASAAAIICSGLLELQKYVDATTSGKYVQQAEKILCVLASPEYTAPAGEYGGFILMHSVGNAPSATERDVPLTYADYYYVEALKRYKELIGNQ